MAVAASLLGILAGRLSALAADPAALTPVPPAVVAAEAESALVGRSVEVVSDPTSGQRFVSFPGPAQPPPTTGVRVAGNRLVRDGEPFVPVGFTMVATARPSRIRMMRVGFLAIRAPLPLAARA